MKAIKEFIDKKKSEAKFKKAGRGHRLTSADGGGASGSSGSSPGGSSKPPIERQHPSQGSQLAGAAALARFDQIQQRTSQSNRSLAVIRAQARKELEAETAAAAGPDSCTAGGGGPSSDSPRASGQPELAANLAVTGVFYKCAIMGLEILPRAEIERNLRDFLFEQLGEDRGMASCLIIHSCNKDRQLVEQGVATLCRYLENITSQPDEPKYRRIRRANKVYLERLEPLQGVDQFLTAAGFQPSSQLTQDGQQDPVWLLPDDADLDLLQSLRDALVSAEPILPELDRNVRVLMPAQAAARVSLPPDFFAITQEELLREAQLKNELVENMTLLQTKAMRERAESREARKYRYCLVRVRFPDSLILQGTFRCLERVSAVFTFVRDQMALSEQQFSLLSPAGQRLQPDDSATLSDAKLVPSILLTWHSDSIRHDTAGHQLFLKPELLELISEL